MRDICELVVEEDGLHFDGENLTAERIIEGARYEGVRVRFTGYLGAARIPMQIDVGFGDALVPEPMEVELSAVLDLPPTVVLGYTSESAIAALDEAFADARRETQWRAFLRRSCLQEPETLREAIRAIAPFALPVLSAIADERPFEPHWRPDGPWHSI